MKVEESYRIAQKILRRSGGDRNPDVICKCLGIELIDTYDLASLKGMYSSADRHRTIFLHKRLVGYLRRFVLAHEIAHDQIPEHRKMARSKPYHELQLFGLKNDTEREANSVAAKILIDDDEMTGLLKEGKDLQQTASELCVPVDLLLIELEDYGHMRPDLNIDLPRVGKGNYLKDYDVWE